MKGTYIGPLHKLQGRTAIIRNIDYIPGRLEAQFDDLSLPNHLTHNWRSFLKSEWILAGEEAEPEPAKTKVVIKMTQPKEWEPDELQPQLLKQRLRDW